MALNTSILETGKYYEFQKYGIPYFACQVLSGNYPFLLKSAEPNVEITLNDFPSDVTGVDIIEISEDKFKKYQLGFIKQN